MATILKEIPVGPNVVRVDDSNTIHIIMCGETDYELAKGISDACDELVAMVNGKVNVLVDLNKAGKATPEARHEGKRRMNPDRSIKIAYFGLHPVAKVLATIMILFAKHKGMRFFNSEEEARKWLAE